MTVQQREDFLIKERTRIRQLRASKKISQESGHASNSTSYHCPQTMGKVLKRAQASLPKSPNKKRCEVSTFAKSVGLTVV